jgi:hypothetical protein
MLTGYRVAWVLHVAACPGEDRYREGEADNHSVCRSGGLVRRGEGNVDYDMAN